MWTAHYQLGIIQTEVVMFIICNSLVCRITGDHYHNPELHDLVSTVSPTHIYDQTRRKNSNRFSIIIYQNLCHHRMCECSRPGWPDWTMKICSIYHCVGTRRHKCALDERKHSGQGDTACHTLAQSVYDHVRVRKHGRWRRANISYERGFARPLNCTR